MIDLLNKQKYLNIFKKPKELQNKSAKLETQLVKLELIRLIMQFKIKTYQIMKNFCLGKEKSFQVKYL